MAEEIRFLGGDTAPLAYTVPGTAAVIPRSASAVFDGTSAAGDFLPCLSFYSQSGQLIGRYAAASVTAGDTAEVTWAPFLRALTAGGFNICNTVFSCGWFAFHASSSGGPDGDGIELLATVGGINLHGSSINLETNGDGLTFETEGGGWTADVGTGEIIFTSQTEFLVTGLPTVEFDSNDYTVHAQTDVEFDLGLDMLGGHLFTINLLAGDRFVINGSDGHPAFEVWADGTVHIRTGHTVQADL